MHSIVDAIFVKCVAAGTEPETGMAFKNIFLNLFYAPNCCDAVAAGSSRSTKSEARVSVMDHDAELKGLLLLVSIAMMNVEDVDGSEEIELVWFFKELADQADLKEAAHYLAFIMFGGAQLTGSKRD